MTCLQRGSLKTGTLKMTSVLIVQTLFASSNLTHVRLVRALNLNASFKLKEDWKLLSRNFQFFCFVFAASWRDRRNVSNKRGNKLFQLRVLLVWSDFLPLCSAAMCFTPKELSKIVTITSFGYIQKKSIIRSCWIKKNIRRFHVLGYLWENCFLFSRCQWMTREL